MSRYTFADCLSWPERERMELVDGEVIVMAPPTQIYQAVVMEVSWQFANFSELSKIFES